MSDSVLSQDLGRPLSGIRVIETATYISGPYAGLILSDLGAEVIKVEPPRGDPLRKFGRPRGSMSSIFANCNRGKKSIVLDFKVDADRDQLLDLAAGSDIVLANWRAESADRMGLGDDVFVAKNPRLIRAYTSGFGLSGPLAASPVFDSTIQAMSGMAYLQGTEGAPAMVKSYLYDKTTGLMVAQTILAALFNRSRTGVGSRIDLSMLDSAAYMNFPDMFADDTFLDVDPGGGIREVITANQPVPARDGWLIVSPVTVAQIKRACEAVGAPEEIDGVLANSDGAKLTRSFVAVIAARTPAKSVAQWLEIFSEHDVAAAPCLSNQEHLEHPQVVSEHLYSIEKWNELGRVRQVRYPATFSDSEPWTARPAPELGADTQSVLAPSA